MYSVAKLTINKKLVKRTIQPYLSGGGSARRGWQMPIQGPCAEASPRQRDAQARLARGPRTSCGSGPNLSSDDIQQFSIGGTLLLVVSRWSCCFRRPSRPLFVACVPHLRPAASRPACLSASNIFW
jgi:hypothetical protein